MNGKQITDALYAYSCEFDAEGLLASFHVADQAPEPGLIRNFLGTRIDPGVYPAILTARAGTVEPVPAPGNWHADIAEWAAALRSVALARDDYRIVELGCGWGCWIVNMGVAARARGLRPDLIGVEGDRYHLASAERTLALNGFAPEVYTLHHGVAASRPGKALFPVPTSDGNNWGTEPILFPDPATLAAAETREDVQILDCLTLPALTGDRPVDLLHIDIQGSEADYVSGNMADLQRLVRRVLIGTHSRVIEGQLCAMFLKAGWRMEMDRPAIAPLVQGVPQIRIDGVQMWANPALVPETAD